MSRAEPKVNRSWTPRWRHIQRILQEAETCDSEEERVERLRRVFTEFFHLAVDHEFFGDTYPDRWFSIQGNLIDRVGDLVRRLHNRLDQKAIDSVLSDVDADTLAIWLGYIDQHLRRGWWAIDNVDRDDTFTAIRAYIDHRKNRFAPYDIVVWLKEQKVSWKGIAVHMEKHYDLVKTHNAWRMWLNRENDRRGVSEQ